MKERVEDKSQVQKISQEIVIQSAKVHNLKAVSCALPHNKLICLTGVSGSGKSSFAFDTIFVEGQRRYVESLSHQAKRLFGSLPRPDVESMTGLTPTISIEQKSVAHNPRSTVGTLTEIYDYLRILFARLATRYCPISGEAVTSQTKDDLLLSIQRTYKDKKIMILAPWVKEKKGELLDDLEEIERKGFTRVRLDGAIMRLSEVVDVDPTKEHDLDIIIDRTTLDDDNKNRVFESLTTALEYGNGVVSIIDIDSMAEELFSTHAYSKKSGRSYGPLEPHDFSFNSPSGMCPECHGLGQKQQYILEKVLDENKNISEDCCSVASSYNTVRYRNIYDNLASLYNFSVKTPFKKLPEEAKRVFLYGTEKKWTRMLFIHPETGATWYDNIQWRGVLGEAWQRYQDATSEMFKRKMEKLMTMSVCPTCHGSRLKAYPSAARLFSKTIQEVVSMTIKEAYDFFNSISLLEKDRIIAQEVVDNIINRLHFMREVGLGYLTLDRSAPTLSGGEAQRVRLASQIGSGLVGVTYVLDEPSIGLHPVDNSKLINSLITLKEKGNTVIVVEHDEETIRSSDLLIDFGPGAGENGGEILYIGDVPHLKEASQSHTKEYLFGTKKVTSEKKSERTPKGSLSLYGAKHNNLKNLNLSIPLGLFVGVTGLSGSGKSSLFLETLFPAISNTLQGSELQVGAYDRIEGLDQIHKVIEIDQSPIGRTPRSNPATYSKVFDEIRSLFASLPESMAHGWDPGRFSFNVKEGSCVECSGMGMVKIDMDFLEESWVECPTCLGQRFDNETLSVRYKGKSIQDVLDMSCGHALQFFEAIPSIKKKLQTLCDVGLDYLRLGQSSTTLSGGEAQRLKLARELSRPDTGSTLYLLDEPTTGLHFHDIQHLMNVLQRLVDRGNTVVVIEHNMDLIKECDWIIDMGPGSGNEGGQIIAEGHPRDIIKLVTPTAIHLKAHMDRSSVQSDTTSSKDKKTPSLSYEPQSIQIVHAEQNNLKQISVEIPRNAITTLIGPSGAGKSSLAFETIYAEGQRRYVESLSPYARQFVKQMPKPKVESITGISPAIAIEQRQHASNPRSTVGTITEVYDYLRIFWSRLGTAHCPKTGKPIKAISKETIAHHILSLDSGTRVEILAPYQFRKGETFEQAIKKLQRDGFTKIRIKDDLYSLDDESALPQINSKKKIDVDVVIDRIKTSPDQYKSIMSSLALAAKVGSNKLHLLINNEKRSSYNLSFSVEGSDEMYPEVTPQIFAFNTKHGMCHDCKGLGFQWTLDLTTLPLPKNVTVGGLIRFFMSDEREASFILTILSDLSIDHDIPVHSLSPQLQQILFHGSSTPISVQSKKTKLAFEWRGLNQAIEFAMKCVSDTDGEDIQSSHETLVRSLGNELADSLKPLACPSCEGTRLNPLARHVTIDGVAIHQFAHYPIDQAVSWFSSYTSKAKLDKAMKKVSDEIIKRLTFAHKIGIGYLSLDRSATTLSGGEAQRVRLVSQIGSGLTGVLYILDEPTVGLHPEDAKKLISALQELKKLNNTVVIVEHDPDIMAISDHIIELGPQGGLNGGNIIFEGPFKELLKAQTITSQAIQTKVEINSPSKEKKKKNKEDGCIQVKNAHIHNLKINSLHIPKETVVAVAGVSGSGKSTLLFDVIESHFHKVKTGIISDTSEISVHGLHDFHHLVVVDQKPMSNTSRSDIATYTELLTPLRHLFATLPDAIKYGLEPKHFSAYHRKGMCTHCWGLGYKKVNMHFMAPIQVECPQCNGMRLNPLSLTVKFKGKNLGEILKLSVTEALSLFEAHPKIMKVLSALNELELGYIHLGQEIATLSSGEAQRAKIARELAKSSRRKTLFLMDEPTTGLHSSEVQTLIRVLRELVNKRGHSVIAIEHNVSFLAEAQHLIELGPSSGTDGGKIIAQGTPFEVQESTTSRIAPYIRAQMAIETEEKSNKKQKTAPKKK